MSKILQIHTDGGSRGNPGSAGIGVVVYDETGNEVFQQSTYLGQATNNEAEYKALLASLEWLAVYIKTNPIDEVNWFLDSKLVVEQISRRWKIKEARLKQLAEQAWQILDALPCRYQLTHVLRDKNTRADELANKAMDAAAS